MPYTPPTQSPRPSRSASFSHPDPRNGSTLNFLKSSNPPRSATYLHKQRRSSLSSQSPAPIVQQTVSVSTHKQGSPKPPTLLDPRASSSVHRSPPPADDGLSVMPAGAIISPPDSAQNSSDEEDVGGVRGRPRDLGGLEEELKKAIKSLPQHRAPSPDPPIPREPSVQLDLGRGRSLRSHHRSQSESSVLIDLVTARPESRSGSISEIEDDAYRIAPAMVRKKSGEVVKSSLKSPCRSRPSSMPSTPTFPPKNVHFDSRIEHVRHFLHSEKPSAVSVGSSPVEGAYDAESEYPFGSDFEEADWEILLPNFPKDHGSRKRMAARLEKICLSTDKKTLIGTVAVANLSFLKHVVARFTFDYWQTVSEVSAEYSSDVRRKEREDGLDRFVFKIKLAEQAHLEKKTLFFCVRYRSGGQEHWDNNSGVNFQVDFKKTFRAPSAGLTTSALPRSRPSGSLSLTRPRSMPNMDEFDLLDEGFLASMKELTVGSVDRSISKPKAAVPEGDSVLPARRANPSGNAFGNRYDFRTSLNAAIKAASTTTPQQHGRLEKASAMEVSEAKQQQAENPSSNATKDPRLAAMSSLSAAPMENPSLGGAGPPDIFNPDNFWTTDKPSIESPSYRELLDNYCFFGSSKATKPTTKPGNKEPPPEKNVKESLQQILLPTNTDESSNTHYTTSPLNGTSAVGSPPSLTIAQQKSSGNASPIPLNYAGYHHRRRGSGAFRFDATKTPTAIC